MAQPLPDEAAPPAPEETAPPAPGDAAPSAGDTAPPAPDQAAPPTGQPYTQPASGQPHTPPPAGQPARAGQPYGQAPAGQQPYAPPPSYQPGYQQPRPYQQYPAGEPYAYRPNPNAQRHDGFYFRVFVGPGYTSFTADEIDLKVSGGGGAFGLAFGGAVSDNVIVYGELFDDIAVGPEVEANGMTATADDISAGVIGVGAGIAYYFIPANVYISGTVSASQLSVQEDGEETGETEFGLGLSAMVGKEWWVSDNWGLGIAGKVFLGQMDEKGADYTYSASALALVFSATYN